MNPEQSLDADLETMAQRRQVAINHCQELINWYEKAKTRYRWTFQVSQYLVIILSGITPLLILSDSISPWLEATPPAVVTMILGINGIFQYKENYLRYAYTSQALKSEKIRFETRSSKSYKSRLQEATALDRFVTRVDNIAMGEVNEWRALMQEVAAADDDS